MDIGIVSIRYAKALLQFAMENHEEDGVYREMSAMADVFMKLPALQKAMQNPVLTSQQTETLLGSACGSGDSQTASTRKFIKLVVSKKRADFMMFIAHAYVTPDCFWKGECFMGAYSRQYSYEYLAGACCALWSALSDADFQ